MAKKKSKKKKSTKPRSYYSRKKVSSKKRSKRNKLAKWVLTAAIILAILLVILLLFNAGVFEGPKEEQLFEIQDACSLVMGNIIHQIRDDGDCHIRCRNECGLREKEFVRVEFAKQNSSCHVCDCYCK